MLLLANENTPSQTCEELKKEGIDILSVREIAPGASDEKVIQIAKKHERLLLIKKSSR